MGLCKAKGPYFSRESSTLQWIIEYIAQVRLVFPDFQNETEKLIKRNEKTSVELKYPGTPGANFLVLGPATERLNMQEWHFLWWKNKQCLGLGDKFGLMEELQQ